MSRVLKPLLQPDYVLFFIPEAAKIYKLVIMTETIHTAEPEFLFSERAFNAAQKAGAVALNYDGEELSALINFINDHSQREPLPPPNETVFIAMHPSKAPWKSDSHYYQVSGLTPFIGSEQLGSSERLRATTTKADLDEAERNIFEYRPWTAVGGMTRWIARRGFGPPPNEAKLVASPSAYGNQWKGLTSGEADKLTEEAVKRFPGAVRIENRPTKRTVG